MKYLQSSKVLCEGWCLSKAQWDCVKGGAIMIRWGDRGFLEHGAWDLAFSVGALVAAASPALKKAQWRRLT
jgi:hypothetical protein